MKVAVADFDYVARQPQELSMKKGSQYKLLKAEPGKNWWQLGDDNGNSGFVPANYIHVVDVPDVGQAETLPATPTPPQPTPVAVPVAVPVSSAMPTKNIGTCLYEYTSQNSEELTIQPGWEVELLEDGGDGWMKVELESGHVGFVPATYIEKAPGVVVPTKAAISPPKTSATVEVPDPSGGNLEIIRALYDFTGGNAGELSFSVGEEFIVLHPEGSDWYQVKSMADPSRVGVVPQNYVEVVNSAEEGYQMVGSSSPEVASSPTKGSTGSYHFHQESLWFHGKLPRPQSEALLRSTAKIGTFLVRDSERTPGNYSVCVLGSESAVKHFRIDKRVDSYVIGARTFSSLPELLEFYYTTPIFTAASGQEIFLLYPAPRQ